jgi:hypothetical protein
LVRFGVDVRRLMYQPLICRGERRGRRLLSAQPPVIDVHHPRRFAAAGDAKGADCPPDTLIDGMAGDAELGGNLLGTEVTIDEA